ncbi:nucleotide sugar dehydrogenase [Haloarcula sp. S1CR25-12]|uniref:UDP-N-acetyl-D-mannosamine dehydrogenase n=1 Tax=Haloarcula saliterrae TaxID=2950534 RepID=A0ABU2FI24_9EURY|nr:nucleotide sugar dehydrogenase [Haloarcula sp. S1CR25-12]MDS0261350.1 nucleotide sugar dehydrogenase [Haloarcula sp. S1CR25-12]
MERTESPACCVVGLGYVGLNLAHMLAQSGYPTVGYDIDTQKIAALQQSHDPTGELDADALPHDDLTFTSSADHIADCEFVFVALPSPLDDSLAPDISVLETASETVGANLSDGAIVVYESTLYPGAVREDLRPALERGVGERPVSFSVGYSPERIAPGEDRSRVSDAMKIVSAEDEQTRARMAALYEDISEVGVYLAESIETAEAAKCLANVQRDVNIAVVNEFTMGARQLDIDLDPHEVLEAAGTKWNFHEYTPGIVGGHCIPVDPHYLRDRFEAAGFEPSVLTNARIVNEKMRRHVAAVTVEALETAQKTDETPESPTVRGDGGREYSPRLLVLGLAYKSGLVDTRNSPAYGTCETLEANGVEVVGYDPHLTREQAREEFDFEIQSEVDFSGFDGVLVLTPHERIRSLDLHRAAGEMTEDPVLVDVDNAFDSDRVTAAGFRYRRP